MIKVLFVCLGNICRSPMAEFVFKDLVKKKNLEDLFVIESAATSFEEIGNDMHRGTKNKLTEENIPYNRHIARRITQSDYKRYDYIIGMEDSNIFNILGICGEDKENKVYKLLDFTSAPRDIDDPWYSGNFDETYNDIVEGCNGFFEFLCRNCKDFAAKNF